MSNVNDKALGLICLHFFITGIISDTLPAIFLLQCEVTL